VKTYGEAALEVERVALLDALCLALNQLAGVKGPAALPDLKEELVAAARELVIRGMASEGIGAEHEARLLEGILDTLDFAFGEANHEFQQFANCVTHFREAKVC
jgi:hypothetical protein